MANIQMRDLRDFLPDSPYSVDSAARMLLNPLRIHSWKTPVSTAEDATHSDNVRSPPL
ncbi:hypothetical protein KIN20_017088 [Parelaphostrongylus tenuis]|uniref:Uncharacterized protein n=1 Tax=Parelaphostrongylus tenuis TaxID=148309 RepID=A0AAD5ML10_PARTN|nr:hypothetical protein KIN20_017088 [Parelaphostrongylus tenuis]